MTQRIILDWDDHQVRMLAVDGHGENLRIREARTAMIPGGQATATELRSALEPLLTPYRASRPETIVLAGGRELQFRLLRVPPVPAEELPELIRLRATSEFPASDESATIDFYPFDHDPQSPQPVLVGRLANSSLTLARDVAAKLHLNLTHVMPRGSGVAHLAVAQRPELQSGVHLAVTLRDEEMDLVGIDHGAAAVVRTVSLPEDSDQDELVRYAVLDMRRTLAAVSSKLVVDKVDSIVWLAGSSRDLELASRVGEQLRRTVTTIDLRELRGATGKSDVRWPDEAGPFAGLLGAGLAVAQDAPTINFLAPRKRIEKKAPKKTFALVGVAAALVLGLSTWFMYHRVARIERETAKFNEEREQIETEIQELAADQSRSEKVAAWRATEVNWLDEIDRLAMSLRPKELNAKDYDAENDVILTSLVLTKPLGSRGVGGSMTLTGEVRDDAVLQTVEQRLRDAQHEVTSPKLNRDEQRKPYEWGFEAEIKVVPGEEKSK